MDKKYVEKAIEYIKELMEQKGIIIDKIILFGSYITGNFTEDSDIDILIISKDFNGKDVFERAKMVDNLEWLLMEKFLIPFDLITMSPDDLKNNISLISQYAKNGKIAYHT